MRDLDRAPALPAPAGVDHCVALLCYEGAGRELVARLKYHNARGTVRWLAVHMSSLIDASDVDVVTWVPTTADRRRRRGFDQAELLARAIAHRLHRPCRRLLARGPGAPQTGRSSLDRRAGPVLTGRRRCAPGAGVLLVDDVITTGTTITVAARALRTIGADHVVAIAAARTPLKRTRSAAPARSVAHFA